ncbi:MAG: triose-phosphate isomerase, partial [Thermoplasmatota archaeon]
MSELEEPAIVVNFKAYPHVEGPRSILISTICEEVSRERGVCVAVCPPMVEISSIVNSVNIPVFSQHVDPVEAGSRTGWVTASMVRSAGAVGTLINHSEHRMEEADIRSAMEFSSRAGLETLVCADTADTAGRLASHSPDYLAVEPPELIGGDVSVTSADPQLVQDAVQSVREVDPTIKVLCGAGVKSGEDVREAIDLGAKGVLVASGVVKAEAVKEALED